MAVPDLNSQELLQLYRQGKRDAATAIFDRYVTRLVALARSRLSAKHNRRVDAEDIVQSAFRSFFLGAESNEFQVTAPGDLWRLLASITLHKLYRQIEKQKAAKRTTDREEPNDLSILKAQSREPSAAEVVAIIEDLSMVMNSLRPSERKVLAGNLQGQTIREISRSTGKSERTTRRLLADAKRKIEQRLLNDVPVIRRTYVEPVVPLHFSDYVLEQLIGSGGMGKLFCAREKSSGKKVAIKALHKSRQFDERAVFKFVQEAQIVSELYHPNIVEVQGLGRFPGGGYFIVMNYVDGTDLQSLLQAGPLRLGEAKRIVKDVAKALQYAHEHGIIHCDIKPGNVLLDREGHVFVTDFGFAFLVSGETPEESIGGTAGYVAPEILDRQSQPTPAADVYALGVLTWTLATGDFPDVHKPPAQGDAALSALHAVCRRCLARELYNRYRSPSEFINAISAL